MNSSHHSSIDPNTGNVSWNGPLSIQKGNHDNMPHRTEAYLPGDERGHVNASSLGGTNTEDNIVAQSADVNHGAYFSMEQGERSALLKGASIDSSKTAVVNGEIGDRPQAFSVTDHITYADGHSESIHHSFTNASYTEQEIWNDQSATLPGTYEAPNPGDELRYSMSSEEYAELMENTDAILPGIADDYAPTDFSGAPAADSMALDSDVSVTNDGVVDSTADSDNSADCDMDN